MTADGARIAAVATAFPPHVHTQQEIFEEMLRTWRPPENVVRRLEAFIESTRVERRHLSVPLSRYGAIETFGQANDLWIGTAVELGEQAITRALDEAGVGPADVDAIYFVSVTGISSPSVDALLANRLGLPPRVKRTPIFGLGCVAGASGLARAADYLKAYPDQVAVLLSVELCSLTFQRTDLSVKNLVASCLFADGAAAVVLVGAEHPARNAGPELLDNRAFFYPATENVMGWKISEKGFEIVLSATVPEVVGSNIVGNVDALLTAHGLERDAIGSWVCHPGGPKILMALQHALGLDESHLAATWHCLKEKGNLSSASLLLVLEHTMRHARPAPGTMGVLAAMGPGFCSELLLARW
ncbi:MAG: 3-oxoacyl-[acyl-carrier-protein] synthase III C-terminal domain-containing protein [Acidobacteriota bacterium]|nr:3-oxoacyl-[acyl-carrier-protein] synthase III C-terminal domain-containing protein [Acidobacteriota bacterium]MDQ7088478.1 3-oxoacyl-[acyl-carrier-protein] synthase III C-terminal domain-containing protein [Acidobacteriota bacterium]